MSYFPLFLDVQKKTILLVGGGNIAQFKLQKIVEFKPAVLRVVAPEIAPQMTFQAPSFVEFHKRFFTAADLDGADLVIVAVDDLSLQAEIYGLCQAKRILCNCVDNVEHCDFIFPSTITKGDITIAMSTSGKVPGFSVGLKDYIESLLPTNLEDKLQELSLLRKSLPKGLPRMTRIREEAALFFNQLKERHFEGRAK